MDIKWGMYPWFVERGMEFIHPDDLEAFKSEASNCKVFECIKKNDYLTLRYNDRCYRVKDKLFRPVPTPKFHFGEKVIINGKDKQAIITDIMWHTDKHEHYYFISIGGKKKSKRFFDLELSKVD